MNEEQYLNERLNDQIKWYSSKGRLNQKLYKRFRLIEIISAGFIPFLSGMPMIPYSKWIIGILGIIIVIAASSSALYKFHENWLEYRTASEALKQEKILYLTKVPPYYDKDDRFQTLVYRTENIMASENQNWIAYSKKSENKSK